MDRAENWTATGFYNVMLHEIGHALGLSHTSENPNETDPIKRNAVMYRSQLSGWTSRQLHLTADDINGVRALFGARQMPSFADMNSLGVGRGFRGSVHGSNDRDDYFRFTLTRSSGVRINLFGLSANADVYLLNSSGTLLHGSANSGTLGDFIETDLWAGDFIIRVDARIGGTSNYRLWLWNLNGTRRARAHSLGDLGGLPLSLAANFRDSVNSTNNQHDYISFSLSRATQMRFELRDLSTDADLILQNSAGSTIGSSLRAGTAEDSVVRWLEPGTYYVLVKAIGLATDYTLRYSRENGLPTAGVTELGDLTSQALARTLSASVTRPLHDDFFRFTLTHASRMRFELRNLSADANLYLLDTNGGQIASSTLGLTNVDSIVRTLAAGTYFIYVDANASGPIRYVLHYENEDVGRTRERAVALGDLTGQASAQVSRGTVTRVTNDNDFFRFILSETRAVRIVLRGLSADADLYLLDSSGTEVASSRLNLTNDDSIIRELGSGTWYIRVDAFAQGAAIGYELRYQTGVTGTVRWAPHELGDLTELTTLRTSTGTVSQATGDNFYRFALGETRSVRLELGELSANADLFLENESGQVLARSMLTGTMADSVVHELGPGTWYVRVNAPESDAIDYQLRYQTSATGTVRWAPHELGDLTSPASTGTADATVSRADTGNRFYTFSLTETRTLRIVLRDLTGDADLYLEYESGQLLESSIRSGTATDSVVHELGAGTWYIRVSAFANDAIEFQLRHQTVVPGTVRWAPHELGDLTGQATAGASTGTVNRTGNDDDFFRFTLGTARTMRFELRNLSADADLHLLNASGVEIVSSRRDGSATDSIVRELGPGTYFVRVDADAAGTIEYQLRYHNESEAPARGTTRETAFAIGNLTGAAAYRIKSGTVNREERDRIYRSFTLTHWRTMRFELRGLSADANLYLEDANGRVLQSSRRSGTSEDTIVRELAPGTWFIRVDANAPGIIRYALRYRREPTPPRGSTHQTAWYIGDLADATEERAKSGSVHRRFNDDDYRRFRLAETRTMRFELLGLTGDANLYLEDETGRVLQGSSASGTSQETIVRKLAAGTWYVRVDAEDERTIRYSLRYAVESESGDGAGAAGSPSAPAATSLAVASHGPWRYDGAMANGNPWRNERDRIDGGGTLLAA